jgi:DNA primase
MASRNKIIEILQENGLDFKEKSRTFVGIPCPMCGREDKFSILKANGHTICYRGSCDYGKKSFVGFIQALLGVSTEEAIEKLKGEKDEFKGILDSGLILDFEIKDPFEIKDEIESDLLSELEAKTYPEWYMIPVVSLEAKEGMDYLESRGITKEIAQKLEIYYSSFYKRVYFPIKINGIFYGYQGRAIKKVSDKDRVRNNEGFRRDTLVMFADNLLTCKDAILAEGPVDAIKFDLVGGYVATMGKEITEKQLQIILNYNPDRIFLALDDDASYEMMLLIDKIPKPIYKIEVPESCKQRCKILGKKADFGECTFEEAKEAKENAKLLKKESLLLYLK